MYRKIEAEPEEVPEDLCDFPAALHLEDRDWEFGFSEDPGGERPYRSYEQCEGHYYVRLPLLSASEPTVLYVSSGVEEIFGPRPYAAEWLTAPARYESEIVDEMAAWRAKAEEVGGAYGDYCERVVMDLEKISNLIRVGRAT